MNERIRELIKSLGIIPENEHYEVAELIIRECADIMAKESRRYHKIGEQQCGMAVTNSRIKILKEFGIINSISELNYERTN